MIRILVTGGTFDKEYNEKNGTLFFRETHLRDMLKLGRSSLAVELEQLFMIDSLEMTDGHRGELLAAVKRASEDCILVTHGTDRMPETAVFLGRELVETGQLGKKRIVLTGAMIPYTFGSSDGLFNLGCALAFVQSLAPGVYIAMNGRYFDWNNVRKNMELGRFEELPLYSSMPPEKRGEGEEP